MNIYYIRSGDYYIPDLTLPEETRPIGKWHGICQGYFSLTLSSCNIPIRSAEDQNRKRKNPTVRPSKRWRNDGGILQAQLTPVSCGCSAT